MEPGRRDTFAAVLLSCSWLLKHGASREDYAAIMPVDPYTEGSYFETVKKLEAIMRESGAEVGPVSYTHLLWDSRSIISISLLVSSYWWLFTLTLEAGADGINRKGEAKNG